jgi:L-rhamnose-H+ transport protein
MNTETLLGLVAIVIGGAMQGSFAVPMKFTRRWSWENIWLVYSVAGMLLLPWMAAFITSPNLRAVYADASWQALLAAGFFGFGWGLGCIFCGLGVVALGIALGSSIFLGLAAALGSLLPLIVLQRDRLFSRGGLLTVLGVAVMLIGISICAVAGRERDRLACHQTPDSPPHQSFWKGLLICVASGIFSAFLNFGFAFGQELIEIARRQGSSDLTAIYPLVALMFTAGFLGNAGYSAFLLVRNNSWGRFSNVGSAGHWPLGLLMGVLVFGGFVLYGFGATQLGALGSSAGWAAFMAMMIAAANTAGFLTGEWKDVEASVVRTMLRGTAVLLAAIVILGLAAAHAGD